MAETKQGGMELLNQHKESAVEIYIYTIKDEEGILVYQEWVQDGEVIDSTLTSKDGETIWDEDIIERVHDFIDQCMQNGTIGS
jgi:hypothetical protein